MSALNFLDSGNGSEGWLSTGASTMSSTIMASAKPPVKHMPTTPTPGPPQRSCSAAASLRSHTVTGLVLFNAKAENSRETQAGPIDWNMYAAPGGRPGSPNSTGRTAVHPAAATRRPNWATKGVMPGISLMTSTAGPVPIRNTVAPFAVGFEGFLVEILELGLPPARFAVRHGGTVASSVVAGPMRSLDPRLPVLVGLGAADQRGAGRGSDDRRRVGGRGRRRRARRCSGTSTASPCPRARGRSPTRLAPSPGASGRPDARTLLCEVGVSQQEVINHALALVASGRAGTVVVAGSEARAWARDGGIDTDEEDRPPDEVLTRPPDFVAPVEIAAGIVWPPVQQYALIENALAAALHLPPERQREEIAALWARFNAVAAHNPEAAFPQPRDAADIATPGPHNRPLSFPYNRWHSSQWTVDQASALVICSAERARAAGVPPERWLFPHVALHSSEAVTLTARRRLEQWPAMEVLGRAAATHLGRPLRELRLAEVYSCFPAAVRVQQRALGLDPGGTPTLTGGMAFAGGPFNHFVLQSLARAGRRRCGPSRPSRACSRPCPACSPSPASPSGRPRRRPGAARRSSPTWRPR